jgi:hypothetical protein
MPAEAKAALDDVITSVGKVTLFAAFGGYPCRADRQNSEQEACAQNDVHIVFPVDDESRTTIPQKATTHDAGWWECQLTIILTEKTVYHAIN